MATGPAPARAASSRMRATTTGLRPLACRSIVGATQLAGAPRMSSVPRRHFLAQLGAGAAGLAVAPRLIAAQLPTIEALVAGRAQVAPERLAEDEAFWAEVRRGFDVPEGVVNLDHGNISPVARDVIEDLVRHVRATQPFPAKRMNELHREVDAAVVRPGLARLLGVPADEVALVRNATEALDTVLLGVPLRAGDEIVCSAHDYFAMLDALEQRRAREGVVLRVVRPPVPLPSVDALAALYERELGPKTRLVLVTHPSNLTGQLAPVRRIADAAHRVGAEVVVDGAQSMALLPYTLPELGCDYFGASLHKWLAAPVGGGVLWMRKESAEKVWPLVPPPKGAKGLDRFTWGGTHPRHVQAAAAPALALHEQLGAARKAARMRYLTSYWRSRVERLPGVRLYTTAAPEASCGLATVELGALDPKAVKQALWEQDRIFVQSMTGYDRSPEIRGIRVTPNVYTSLAELDRFAGALIRLVRHGIG
jgi:isopenicillin-N epimerase